MVYKDKTFCPYFKDCKKQKNCSRPLVDEVVKDAEGLGLYISVFSEKPSCHSKKGGDNV